MGIEDPAIWAAMAAGVAAAFRPLQNIIIFFIAVRGARPSERSEIIDSLSRTRQFGLWSKPRWSGPRAVRARSREP